MKIFKDVVLVAAAVSVSAMTLTAVAAPAYANGAAISVNAEVREPLYDAEGARVARVYRVANDGSVLVIYKGELRKIGVETLSNNEGKLSTSLTRKQIRRLK